MPPYYPVNDFGPLIKGLIIGGLGIVHVFLAQFAIGGGMLMCYFERLSARGRSPDARRLLDEYFQVLVLISFVLGALTGVAMWFTTIQVSPRTIGVMVDEFHWLWAVEWTFFCLEIVSGYAFYRCGRRLPHGTRMTLLVLYSAAAWFSLFWINGILSWQLTPGHWTQTHNVWDGFFNPGFLPSLLYRTVVSLTIAALVACVVVNTMPDLDYARRRKLINQAAWLLLPMILMPVLGIWYVSAMPADSRSWLQGGSAAMTIFLSLAVGASLLIGGYALIGLIWQRLYVSGATATLLVLLALGATAGGEFVREGVRKPFTIRSYLYSNSIRPDEVERLRAVGGVSDDPYPLRDAGAYPNDQVRLGAKVFRFQCSVCHTPAGVNGLTHLTGTWDTDQKRMNIAKLQHTKPFMPPFAGNAEELEALVQWLDWYAAGRPETWTAEDDGRKLETIGRWLAEAGTRPADKSQRLHGR